MFRLSFIAVVILLAFSATATDKYQAPGPVHLDKQGEKWARESLKKMSLEQKIGQMFIIWARVQFFNQNSPQYIQLRDTMLKYHIGGFGLTVTLEDGILYKNEPYEAAMLTNQLQKDSPFPLLFGADFEHGLGMRLNGVTNFPHAMAFGAIGDADFVRESARITAKEARAIGVHWNWFPDADVNSNPNNPIINTRSFGEDPQQVSAMVTAYIEGAHEFGMLTTAKHFPGHGDTETDSHLAVPEVKADRAHLESVELPPFRAAVKAGVDTVMVAHLSVPALDPDPNHVATISSAVVSDLLKKQMGFQGLVVTDALDMNGLRSLFTGPDSAERAAVEAVKAGNDLLLIPSNLDGSYKGLLQAVRSGEIPESRIDQSVLKILRVKASVGLNRAKLVDVSKLNQMISAPKSLELAQDYSDAAVTLVRDNHRVLPLKAERKGTIAAQNPYQMPETTESHTVLLIFTDDPRLDAGRVLDQEMRRRVPGIKTIYVDPRSAAGMTEPVMNAVHDAQAVVAAVFAVPVAGRVVRNAAGTLTNQAKLQGASAQLLENVVQSAGDKMVVVALGNPYIAAQVPEVPSYLCTFSDVPGSELSAVKALFGEIPMPGHLPVTIPNFASRGAGLGGSERVPSGGSR